jgi:hypothetical protein
MAHDYFSLHIEKTWFGSRYPLLSDLRSGSIFSASGIGHPVWGHHIMTSSFEDIRSRIVELEVEHRDLDAVIDTLMRDGHHDELRLRRLKKRRLQLKDHISMLKMQLVPDVPA